MVTLGQLLGDTAGWIAPTLAFVGAVLGGGLVAAMVSSLHERRENLRSRQVEAAQSLLESCDRSTEFLEALELVSQEARHRQSPSSTEESYGESLRSDWGFSDELAESYVARYRARRHQFESLVDEKGIEVVWRDLHSKLAEELKTAKLELAKIELLFPTRSGVSPRAALMVIDLESKQVALTGDPTELFYVPRPDSRRDNFVHACSDELQGGFSHSLRTRLRPRGTRSSEF